MESTSVTCKANALSSVLFLQPLYLVSLPCALLSQGQKQEEERENKVLTLSVILTGGMGDTQLCSGATLGSALSGIIPGSIQGTICDAQD